MNLINSTIFSQNIPRMLENWIDSKPVSGLIDEITYDLYEDSNPFRTSFTKEDINNRTLRIGANVVSAAGAEVFSAFANPYYLSHKITHIPVYYENAVLLYKNN